MDVNLLITKSTKPNNYTAFRLLFANYFYRFVNQIKRRESNYA